MIQKIIWTALLVIAMFSRALYYNALNYRSQAAILQLQDSNELSALGRAAANAAVSPFVWLFFFILFYAIWRKELNMFVNKLRNRPNGSHLSLFLIVVLLSITLSACFGPAYVEPLEIIQPNETAFLIPATGASESGQAKFGSVDFLEENKVATKRISIPMEKHKNGRWTFEYVPTVILIKVDRTPVSRIWSPEQDQDTNGRDEGFRIESFESVGFTIGVKYLI